MWTWIIIALLAWMNCGGRHALGMRVPPPVRPVLLSE